MKAYNVSLLTLGYITIKAKSKDDAVAKVTAMGDEIYSLRDDETLTSIGDFTEEVKLN